MGLMRKTLSISTLGLIPFRSRKDKLRKATRERDEAAAALHAELAAKAEIEERLAAAKRRASEAELLALVEAGRATRAERKAAKEAAKRKKKRGAARDDALHAIEAKVKPLGRRARKAEAKAMKRAHKLSKRAGAVVADTRKHIDDAAGSVEQKAEELSRRARKRLAKAQKKTGKRAKKLRSEATDATRDAAQRARDAAVAQAGSVEAAIAGKTSELISS